MKLKELRNKKRFHPIEKIKLVQEIDLKELEHIIFHRAEYQIIELT